MDSLNLEQYVEHSKGFTYADKNRRLVFLHEDLSDNEKLVVLAHKEGHIYCNHFTTVPVIGKDVAEEHEANDFSHYILNQSLPQKFSNIVKRRKTCFLVGTIAVLVLIAGVVTLGIINTEKSYYGEYYITSTGNKYHEKECIS